MGSSLNPGPFRVLFIRVPYYFGNPKRDPNLENYPYRRFLREPTFTYQNLLFLWGSYYKPSYGMYRDPTKKSVLVGFR